ncbi:glycoside hydrolase family 38 C-terminal domain-containing protein [Lactobacillus sp. ESL0677]|uniref:glycoside hydrolase family 38 N-terminal domain-containing protein n=1 Tax=Lactobacillus sp. ESL0677 TaxID=2983208 RepID=UPI0023F81167|nr:glycoside hydrolase family 38 C-terminal domain-containing protein [Lactobacillus sp. ESL0677]WEV37644.1 alpha-mannosidase [Lactobacillus sp. ESL0677]
MVKQVFVVPHTHWDREWFFTSSKAKVYLMKDLKDVIDKLEESSQYGSFLLDGQSSLIEDYLAWRPEDKTKVQQLVKEKKLFLGPWYTQTDQYLVSAESIVNNLRIGMKECEKLGGYMDIAYVPDSFGQESSMPQIYRELGIKNAVLYRGFSSDTAKNSEFIWQGEDGSTVNVYRMACGYFIGGVVDESKLTTLMDEEPFKTVVSQATTNNVLFPNGSDMAPIRFDLPEFIAKLNQSNLGRFNFKVSSLEDYIKEVNQDKPKLAVLTGEQDLGKDMRVHKSIYSSRSDLKKLNTKLQHYLSNVMEPVLMMGSYFGLSYPIATVHQIWKLMFENSAHDSMGNCVSDTVNEDINMRYKQVKDIATSLVDVTLRQISTKINDEGHKITLTAFNTLPYKRSCVLNKTIYVPSRDFNLEDKDGKQIKFQINTISDVTTEVKGATIQLDPSKKIYLPEKVFKVNIDLLLKNIPAFGYKEYFLIPAKKANQEPVSDTNGREIENQFYKINVNLDGSLNILDKENGHLYRNQGILEENGDGGDSYNYSPAKKDLIIYSTNQRNNVYVKQGMLKKTIQIKFEFNVPSDLTKRAQGITDSLMPVILEVSLDKLSKIINFKINIDNHYAKSHRLCIDFDSDIVTNTSIADIQFGSIKRPLIKEKELANWQKDPSKWQEKPISINTMQSYVALSQRDRLMAIIANGVREYECIGRDYSTIRLTVFRTYGMLGKKDLIYRPGRASGDDTVATSAAQLNKNLSFDFGLILGHVDFDKSNLANEVKEFETPIQIYEYSEFLNGRLIFPFNPVSRNYDPLFSLFEIKGELTVSTIEKAQNRPGYAIRLFNSTYHDVLEQIKFKKQLKVVQLVNLKEEKITDLEVKECRARLPKIGHSKFLTVYFEL